MKNYKILIIGLGSIGKNLALSLTDKGYKINVWDKSKKKNLAVCEHLKIKFIKNILQFVKSNNTIIILAIPAGAAIDNLICSVALWVRVDKALTSSATTAKPRPCSPALAASIAALSASKLV